MTKERERKIEIQMDCRFRENFTHPINSVIGKILQDITYSDSSIKENLNTQSKIHIISHEIGLYFSDNQRLFISWSFGKGWEQYVVGCSNNSFFDSVPNQYKMSDDPNWKSLLRAKIDKWSLWGYLAVSKDEMCRNEPHLLELTFSNQRTLYFANFYFEEDFEPEDPVGDDLWIIFDKAAADEFIAKFKFEKLL